MVRSHRLQAVSRAHLQMIGTMDSGEMGFEVGSGRDCPAIRAMPSPASLKPSIAAISQHAEISALRTDHRQLCGLQGELQWV